MSANGNESIFPRPERFGDGEWTPARIPATDGLTKRELFAAIALQGYVASPDTTNATYTAMALDAVAAADALLTALEATP